MSVAADRAGSFKAEIIEYGIFEADSGAVSVNIVAKLLEMWDGEQWQPWDYDMEAEGGIWVVKKDGKLNDKSVESLMRYTGWNGDIESVVNKTWTPTRCQVVLNEDTYNGVTRYKISFVNGYDSTPGGKVGNVTPDKAKQLAGKYGSQLRALFGNVKRSTPAPSGDRPAPPPGKLPGVDSAKTRSANKQLSEAAAGNGDEEIPF